MENSLKTLVCRNLCLPLGPEPPTDDSIAEGNSKVPKERPPGYVHRVQRQEMRCRSRVAAVRNADTCATLEKLDDLVKDFLLYFGDFVDAREGRVEDRPVEPGEHLMAMNRRPGDFAKPREHLFTIGVG